MPKNLNPFLLILLIFIVPVSATYTQTFDASTTVVVNQSIVLDPTNGTSTPWLLWIIAGISGLALSIYSLVRAKTNRMDYEVNIILSVIAWPFFGYFAWGGITSVDYVVGMAATTTSTGAIAAITQHILYTFWLLGWIGVGGFIASVFITILLVSQYNLFKDNETMESQRRVQE